MNMNTHNTTHNTQHSTFSGTAAAAVAPDDTAAAVGAESAPVQPSPATFTGKEKWDEFDGMGLSEDLLRGIYSVGFEVPSAVQRQAIVPIAHGVDVLAQAQSGTGKTATFSIGTLQRIDPSDPSTQVIILSPTRELAKQTHDVFESLSVYMAINSACFRGGQRLNENIAKLRQRGGCHACIGTPGRMLDLIERGLMDTRALKTVVIDEADEMLDAGFLEQMKDIFNRVPKEAQCVFVSATMPEEAVRLSASIMSEHRVEILVKREQVTLEGIRQFYVAVDDERYKIDILKDLYEAISVTQAVIFTNRRRTADEVAHCLGQEDFTCAVLHGETAPEERDTVLDAFRSGRNRILICSDILARGIDVQQVSLVVNFDIPQQKESYIHRVGRCGRYGRKGAAINFVTRRDTAQMREIEQFYDTEVSELPAELDALF